MLSGSLRVGVAVMTSALVVLGVAFLAQTACVIWQLGIIAKHVRRIADAAERANGGDE